ncbi:circadian clock protein KaiC [Oscillatoria sp. FACHB-1407]|uniref:circadian clock protein KaiC n=1 Tax=Oscillatoria sp. FACHB-1407 TaxID=2692847 RepID=UPI0016839207|nr:circadian clock protein KaiC [Oscillatoria sp. FACHB-1407]MBD2464771.1 circadian clock protein KaiC [Oscillatoria sp. FACHB-1407]
MVQLADSTELKSPVTQLSKCPTGIQGLDEITEGGLPKGRPTLVCGSAGCGKTLLGLEFLVRGATQYGEPGVFISFEETVEELTQNVASLGWDLSQLIANKQLEIDCFYIDPAEIQETGEYDLEGLFIRLGSAIDRVGAKRIVLDTIEVLFSGLSNVAIVRAELRRLFRWLKTKGVTAIITGERGENNLTRQGLEEYVSDCVIRLDQRIFEELSTRRLQVLKYRGSQHGSNEYPFLIDKDGISVLPLSSIGLNHRVSSDRISSGIPRLDTMLDGQGYFRGSSILVTGMAGTGKSTIAAHFAAAACQRGERCLYLAFEEAPQQILRNMRSVNLDLEPYIQKGLLHIEALRPTVYSLELHLVQIHRWLNTVQPSTMIIDPISNLILTGTLLQARSFFIRLIDYLKSQQITVLMTNLIAAGMPLEHTEMGVSSLMDTWLEVRAVEGNGERNRLLQLVKSRGMAHSNQVREFRLTGQGVDLLDVYLGQNQVLTGTARAAQESADKQARLQQQQQVARRRRQLEQQQKMIQDQIATLQMQMESESAELEHLLQEEKLYAANLLQDQQSMARLRQAD